MHKFKEEIAAIAAIATLSNLRAERMHVILSSRLAGIPSAEDLQAQQSLHH